MKYCYVPVESEDKTYMNNVMEIKQPMAERCCISGMSECAHTLEMHPESVIRCILPYTVEADISMKIQHKLIEAYCWENEIEVVKVSSTEEITAALQNTTVDVGNEVDLDCLLVCDKEQLLVADSDTEFMDWDPDDDFKNGPS